jgi:hypothetical protein
LNKPDKLEKMENMLVYMRTDNLEKMENMLVYMRTDNLESRRLLLRLGDQINMLMARSSHVGVQVEEQVEDLSDTCPPYSPVVRSPHDYGESSP